MLEGARVVLIAPSPRVRATSSPASALLIERRVKDLLPQSTQRAQARLAQLKHIFVTTTAAARHAEQRRAVREVLERVRLTKTVRNVQGVPVSSSTNTKDDGASQAGTLCMPFTCCAALAAGGLVVTGAVDGRLTLWDVNACSAVATQLSLCEGGSPRRGGFRGRVCRLATHPSLPLVFSTTMHASELTAWRVVHGADEAVTNKEEEEEDDENTARPVSLTALGSTMKEEGDASGHAHGPIRGLAADPTGNVVASAACDGTLCVWDLHTLQPCLTTPVPPAEDKSEAAPSSLPAMPLLYRQEGYETVKAIRAVSFHPDGALLTTGDDGGRVVAWDMRSGKLAFTTSFAANSYGGHLQRVRCVAWSPCGIRFASGGEDTVIQLWDARRLSRERTRSAAATSSAAPFMMLGHGDAITSLSFHTHPRGQACPGQGGVHTNTRSDAERLCGLGSVVPIGLVSTSLDHSLRIWDADTGLCVRSLDAGSALYDHCRPILTSTASSKQLTSNMMHTTPAAIFTVGHHKYWSVWDCIRDEDSFEPVVHETALVAQADQLTRAVAATTTTAATAAAAEESASEEESEEDEMMALRRPAQAAATLAATTNNEEEEEESDDDEDEMALLRVKRTRT